VVSLSVPIFLFRYAPQKGYPLQSRLVYQPAWMRDFTSLANPLILIFVPFAVLGPSRTYYILLAALLLNEIVGSFIKIIFPKKRPTGQTYKNYLTLFAATPFLILKILFILVIALVGISRVFLKKHFPVDVLGGLICGAFIFWLSGMF